MIKHSFKWPLEKKPAASRLSFRRDLNEAKAVYISECYLVCRFVIMTPRLRLGGLFWNLRIYPPDDS